jgi:hypothetical protein
MGSVGARKTDGILVSARTRSQAMLLRYVYEGNYFSSLRNTYTDYGSWSESCAGAGGLPSDESIELFLDRLSSSGIAVIDRSARCPQLNLTKLAEKYAKETGLKERQAPEEYAQFDGFLVTHFRDARHVDALLALVADGRSLLFISFDSAYSLYRFPEEGNGYFLSQLQTMEGLPAGQDVVTLSHGLGRILLLSGSAISDHALDTWKDRQDPDQGIAVYPFLDTLIDSLKSFNIPYLTANSIAPLPSAWLTGEAVIVAVRFINLGKQAQNVRVALAIPDYVEPLCATEFFWDQLNPADEKYVNFVVRCSRAGSCSDYLDIRLSYEACGLSFSRQYPVSGRTEFVSASAAFTGPDSRELTGIDLLRKYQALEGRLGGLNNMAGLLELVEIDPASTILKSRTILEKIVTRVAAQRLRGAAPHDLDGTIRRLRQSRVISNKLCGWMHTVRILGNMMAHPDDDSAQANREDALAVVNILLNLIGELVDKELL